MAHIVLVVVAVALVRDPVAKRILTSVEQTLQALPLGRYDLCLLELLEDQ